MIKIMDSQNRIWHWVWSVQEADKWLRILTKNHPELAFKAVAL